MTEYSAWPMFARAWGDPHVDLENPRFVISVEWTWPEGDWSHFSIVRSARSPVRRREEGQIMMETVGRVWDHYAYQTTGLPVYRDPQPPPGEWVYYTAFVLDPNRVWNWAGEVAEISIDDYDWALRLPEILPGVAIGDLPRTVSPAEQSNDLVQFLQTPGALLDKVVTMGEAAQYFWEPTRVPPQMFRAMTESLGFEYDENIGLGRARHAVDALTTSQQGSLPFIRRYATGVSGCDTRVTISNNLMLDVNNSSFEDGLLTSTNWTPTVNLELRKYENYPDKSPSLHPNVRVGWFAYLKASGTYFCGRLDPVGQGIPVASWTQARMGVHAYAPSATAVTVTLGLRLYDYLGKFLREVVVLPAKTITQEWAWYGNADNGAVALIPTGPDSEGDALLRTANWRVDAGGSLNWYTNMLTANQASVETDLTGLQADDNCTIARSTAVAAHGTACVAMTCNDTSDPWMAMRTGQKGTGAVAVTPGTVYTATASFRAATVTRPVEVGLAWFDSGGAYITKVSDYFNGETTTGWLKTIVSGTAPAAAAYASVIPVVSSPALNEVHYVDKLGIWPGRGPYWGTPTGPVLYLGDQTGNGKDLVSNDGVAPLGLAYTGSPPPTYLFIPTGSSVSIANMTAGLAWTATRLDGTTLTGTHSSGTFTFSTGGTWTKIATAGGEFVLNASDVIPPYTGVLNAGTAGGTWSINRAATGTKLAVVDKMLVQFYGAQSLQTPTLGPMPVGTFMIALRNYSDTVLSALVKTDSTGSNGFRAEIAAGATTFTVRQGTGSMVVDSSKVGVGEHVLAFSYNGTTTKVYVDGVSVGSFAGTGQFLQDFVYVGSPTYSAMQFRAAALWNRVLTDDEILKVSTELPLHGRSGHAYAVPLITVNNPCSVDLIVVDDG